MLLLPLLGLITGITLWTSYHTQQQLRQSLASTLTTVLNTVHEAVRIWADDRKSDVSVLAQSGEIRVETARQLVDYRARRNLLRTDALRRLRTVMAPALKSYRFVDFEVVAPEGVIIASNRNDEIGVMDSDPAALEVLERTLRGELALRMPSVEQTDPRMLIGAPIRDPQGKIIATLEFRLDPALELRSVTILGRLRDTGETYAVDRAGRFLTESRFGLPQHDGLIMAPNVVRTIAAQPTGIDLEGYPNYRGVPAVGAWKWDEDLGIALVTEITRDEALGPSRFLWSLTMAMILTTLAAVLVVFWFLGSRAKILASNFGYQQALQARRDLLAVVSHDLKNPLNMIGLTCYVLKSNWANRDRNFFDENIDRIRRGTITMSRLISDLLDGVKLEAGQLVVVSKPSAVDRMVQTAMESAKPMADEKHIKIDCEVPTDVPPVQADSLRIIQVLSNLLSNAIKFTPPGGEIRLSVKTAATRNQVEFKVSDTGRGIRPEDLPHVFEQFWQAQPGHGIGSGLGLFICKKLIDAHHGTIHASSIEGKGTIFVFTLPVASSSSVADVA